MNQKNIAIGALLVSVIALAVAGYSLNTLTTRLAAKASQVLVYDLKITNFIMGNVSMSTDPTGNTFFVAAVVYPQDQIDKTASVGTYTCDGTITNSAGDDIAMQILEITGQGMIILNGPELVGTGTPTGPIVGGTGQFTGAQGTYTLVGLTDTTARYTLTITSTASS